MPEEPSHLFYIYKSDRPELVQELTSYLEDNGATVIEWEDRYKHRLDSSSTTPGFILVDPTQYPLILASRHVSLGFPFVNWAFARACIESEINPTAFISDARKRLLFMKDWDGTRWKFYLHPEFPNSRIRALKVSIEDHAGVIVTHQREGQIIICPCGILAQMNVQYANNLQQRAESDQWLEEALSTNVVVFTEPRLRVLPGGKAGRPQAAFTDVDVDNLVTFLATRVREGRCGMKAYEFLTSKLNSDKFPWAIRHTKAAWSRNYRNNRDKYEVLIGAYLRTHRPVFRGAHGYAVAYLRESSVVSSQSTTAPWPELEDDSIPQCEEGVGVVSTRGPGSKSSLTQARNVGNESTREYIAVGTQSHLSGQQRQSPAALSSGRNTGSDTISPATHHQRILESQKTRLQIENRSRA